MIKSNELRIGNIFNPIIHVKVEAWMLLPESEIVFEPIPLTEKWLIRFGFRKVIGWFITTNPNASLEVSENNDNSNKQWYCYVRNINGIGLQDDFVLLRKDLMYVHQLQNLYFALTGIELELK